MGLDCSHEAWSGSYSSFNRWREKIGVVAGYRADLGYEYYDKLPDSLKVIDWCALPHSVIDGEWETPPEDPLLVLLAHSDCDGKIPARFCTPLAERLEELLPLLPDGEAGGHIRHWRHKTEQFIDGLLLAAKRGEDIEFY